MKYLILLCVTLSLSGLATSALAADFVLVVNKNNPIVSLSDNDAKQIFLGKKTSWGDGQTIMLYSQQSEDLNRVFAEAVPKKTAQQFQIYWKKALFTGTGRPPIELKDNAEMKKFIAADPRGIGYLDRSALDGSVKEVRLN